MNEGNNRNMQEKVPVKEKALVQVCDENKFFEMFHVKHVEETLEKFHVKLSEQQIDQLYVYYANLITWNRVMNLTGITDPKEVIEKHFLDSLAIALFFGEHYKEGYVGEGRKLIDVGTGAGMPGMILAICYPELQVDLMDSLRKRIDFLNDTIKLLDLKNCRAIHARAEDLAQNKEHREKYDFAVARAVANLPVLSEYCVPFLRNGGFFVAYKTVKAEEELKSCDHCFDELKSVLFAKYPYEVLAGEEKELFVIQKQRSIAGKYPRKAGTPVKKPL